MSWRYIAAKDREGYHVHEYYSGGGYTVRPILAYGSTREELITDLERMLADVKMGDVLNLETEEIE